MSFEAFLKIDGIEGSSTDDKHKNWIEILSFSHGVSQPLHGGRSSGAAATASKSEHQDVSVVKQMDKASPLLFLNCCNGKHTKATIEFCLAAENKHKYLEYKLEDVVISSVRPGGSSQGSDSFPLEEVSLNYGKIEVIFYPTDEKGKSQGAVPAKWDRTANK